jgi:hypothetical protein
LNHIFFPKTTFILSDKREKVLTIFNTPTHSRLLKSTLENCPVSDFNGTAANEPTVVNITSVINIIYIIINIT